MNLYEVMVQPEGSKVKFSVYVVARDLKHAQGQVDHMNNTLGAYNHLMERPCIDSINFTLTEDILEGFGEMSELPNIH